MEKCRFLRPCLQRSVKPAKCLSYARFFTAVSRSCAKDTTQAVESDHSKRLAQLEKYHGLDRCYPRVTKARRVERVSVQSVYDMAAKLARGESGTEQLRVVGMKIDNATCYLFQSTECARQSVFSPFRRIQARVS